jgi:hypothetical protein
VIKDSNDKRRTVDYDALIKYYSNLPSENSDNTSDSE